jgi:hypothetical protein
MFVTGWNVANKKLERTGSQIEFFPSDVAVRLRETMHFFRFLLVGSACLWHFSLGFSFHFLSTNSLGKVARTHILSSYSKDDRSGSSGGASSSSSPFQEWQKDPRINVLNLLTQRAIQSFMFLCESVRDPHSGKWIEDFLGAKNQLEYHGSGATYCCTAQKFGGTWDGPLLAMMEQPKVVVVVRAKRRGRCVLLRFCVRKPIICGKMSLQIDVRVPHNIDFLFYLPTEAMVDGARTTPIWKNDSSNLTLTLIQYL